MSKIHEYETTGDHDVPERLAVPGGWHYLTYASRRTWLPDGNVVDEVAPVAAVFVPDPAAPHVRDDRRLRLREGWKKQPYDVEDGWVTLWRNLDSQHVAICEYSPGRFIAVHADESRSDHSTLLEAHDALIASGSHSPFEVVVGPVQKGVAP